MRKLISDDYPTKAKKREAKKRLRMKMHGASLRKPAKFGGHKITAR